MEIEPVTYSCPNCGLAVSLTPEEIDTSSPLKCSSCLTELEIEQKENAERAETRSREAHRRERLYRDEELHRKTREAREDDKRRAELKGRSIDMEV